MDTLNVSYSLNNLGPWSDPLLAGILGSASSVNMLEPLSSALPVITGAPGQFNADHLLPASSGAASSSTDTTPAAGSSTDTKDKPLTGNVLSDLFDALISVITNPTRSAVQISTGSLPSTPSDEKKAGYLDSFMKNSVIVVVALILLVFGLWILLAPTVKPMIVDASKAAAA